MKFSVVIGIMQMVFGLIIGLLNHQYFKRRVSILFEFIPQIIFITLIFVYLVFMIFIKWIKYAGTDDEKTGSCAPNLLLELINMFFLKDSSVRDDKSIDYCKRLYPGQHMVQTVFVIISMMCIPVMLLTKPLLLLKKNNDKKKHGNRLRDFGHHNPLNINGSTETPHSSVQIEHEEEHEEHFDFGEIFVEQTIHTIEYFLGCVSHTASYLRLWALSWLMLSCPRCCGQ